MKKNNNSIYNISIFIVFFLFLLNSYKLYSQNVNVLSGTPIYCVEQENSNVTYSIPLAPNLNQYIAPPGGVVVNFNYSMNNGNNQMTPGCCGGNSSRSMRITLIVNGTEYWYAESPTDGNVVSGTNITLNGASMEFGGGNWNMVTNSCSNINRNVQIRLPSWVSNISSFQVRFQNIQGNSPHDDGAIRINSFFMNQGCRAGTNAPNLSSTNIANICPNNTVNLTSINSFNTPSGTSLTWHSGSPATNANKLTTSQASAVGAGIYYASFFDANFGCYSPTQIVSATINQCCKAGTNAPNLSSTNIANICPNNTANLTSINSFNTPSGTSLTWHSGSPATNANKLTISQASAVGAGNYYASFFDESFGCYSPTQVVNVIINLPPVIGGATNVCEGNTANITPNNGGIWTSSNPNIATVSNSGLVTGINFGQTTLTFNNSSTGCSNSIIFNVNPNHSIESGENITTCLNIPISEINLSTTGATNVLISGLPSGLNGTWSNNVVTINGIPSELGNFLYTITTLGSCESASTSGTISVKGAQILNTFPSFSCGTNSISLSALATSGSVLRWYNQPTGGSSLGQGTIFNTPIISETTTFYVEAELDGCISNRIPVLATIYSVPVITSTSTNPTICNNPNGTITINGLSSNQSYTISYTRNGFPQTSFNFMANAQGQYTILNLLAGSYSLAVFPINTNCSSNTNNVVLVDPVAPVISISHTNPSVCGLNNGNFTISGLIPNNSYVLSYRKNGILQTPFVFFASETSYILNGLGAGFYNQIRVIANGCLSNQLSVNLIEASPVNLEIVLLTNPTSCDANNGSITIGGLQPNISYILNYVKDGVQQTSFPFTPIGVTYTLSALSNGVYSGINVSAFGCFSNSLSATLQISNPIIDVTSINPSTCIPGNDGSLIITGLAPNSNYEIFYKKNNIEQTPIQFNVNSTSYIINGLTEGEYLIYVKQGICISNSVNAILLPGLASINSIPESVCKDEISSLPFIAFPSGGEWYSDNPDIATVDSNGFVQGVNSGNAIIRYITPGGCVALTTFTVKNGPNAGVDLISCSNNSVELFATDNVGSGGWLASSTNPIGASFSPNSFSTNNPIEITFSQSAAGVFEFTYIDENCSDSVKIEVGQTPPQAILSKDCNNSYNNAVITIESPLGQNFEYSLNGIDFQDFNLFSNLSNGTYYVTVKNKISSCTSISQGILIDCVWAQNDINQTQKNVSITGDLTTNDLNINQIISANQGNININIGTTTNIEGGTITIFANGKYIFTPSTNFSGIVPKINYTGTNNSSNDNALLYINVIDYYTNQINNKPIANHDTALVESGDTVTIDLLSNDSDIDQDNLNVSQIFFNGSLLLEGIENVSQIYINNILAGNAYKDSLGKLVFIASPNYFGEITFEYIISDGINSSETSYVTISIVKNIFIYTNDDANSAIQGQEITGNILINDQLSGTNPIITNLKTDFEGIEYIINLNIPKLIPNVGTITINSDGNYHFIPVNDFINTISVEYEVCNASNNCNSATLYLTNLLKWKKLQLEVLLQGPLFGTTDGKMRDDLRFNNVLPLTEPYKNLELNGNTRFLRPDFTVNETTTNEVLSVSGDDAIVDWVFVELRDPIDSTIVLKTKSALVQRDGDIVESNDGVSSLSFENLTKNSYYISVKHRNHLGVMTAFPVSFSGTNVAFDFTTATPSMLWNSAPMYEGFEQEQESNGKYAMWAGNTNGDRKVKYAGSNNDQSVIFSSALNYVGNDLKNYNFNNAFPGYFNGDVNMDAKVKYRGIGNDPTFIFFNIVSKYTLNVLDLYNYDIFIEQTPN